MTREIVRPYSLELSVSSKYECREILHFRFSSKYLKRVRKVRRTNTRQAKEKDFSQRISEADVLPIATAVKNLMAEEVNNMVDA